MSGNPSEVNPIELCRTQKKRGSGRLDELGLHRLQQSQAGAECPPLLHPMNWSVKRRYDTIWGRAGDSEIVNWEIILREALSG